MKTLKIANHRLNLSLMFAFLFIFTTACSTISTQYNLMELMKDYKFSESADEVYAGAKKYFNDGKMSLTPAGDHIGVTSWTVDYVSQGDMSHTEKVRYKVTVSTLSDNKTLLRVEKESIPDTSDVVNVGQIMGGEDMLTPETMRDVPMEYQILASMNTVEAANLEKQAAQ